MKLFLIILITTILINNYLISQVNTNNKNNTFLNKDKDLIKDNLLKYDNLIFGTYINTNYNDQVYYSGKDNEGNYFICGYTQGVISTLNSKIQNYSNGNSELFFYKLDSSFNIIWSTMLGGGGSEYPLDAVISSDGDLWVCGETYSSDFPRTRSPYNNSQGNSDGFLVCVSKEGYLKFSEIFSSTAYDAFTQVALDKNGVCYAGGRSTGQNFQVTPDAKVKNNSSNGYNGILVKVDLKNNIIYSSYLISNSNRDNFVEGLAVDNQGNIVVSGHTNDCYHQTLNAKLNTNYRGGDYDIFIQKYDKDFNLIWDNLFGDIGVDKISGIQIDNINNIYLLCFTTSNNLPEKNSLNLSYKNMFDAYLLSLLPDGEINWSTYIGSSGQDGFLDGASTIDKIHSDIFLNNNIVAINFKTKGNDLPITNESYQKENKSSSSSNTYDSYSILLNLDGSLYYSTYYGTEQNEWTNSIWFDERELIICGLTNGNITTTSNAISSNKMAQNDGFVIVLGLEKSTSNNTPPSISSQSTDDCGNIIEYFINDDNNPYGYKNINILRNDNCSVITVIKDRILKLTISKNSLDKKAYYKIEITNQADKKLIIEDSLLANSANMIRTEPKDFFDVGKISLFNKQYCQDIKIFNDSESEFTITDSYFKNYKYFSFSLSQIPLTIPAKSNRDFSICISPQDMKHSLINDTLVLIADCFFKELPAKAEYYIPNLNSDSKCDVSLELVPDSAKFFNYQTIVSHNNELLIETDSKVAQSVEMYDLYSAKINEINISNYTNLIKIDFNNLANGIYFIYIKEEKSINVIQLYLIR